MKTNTDNFVESQSRSSRLGEFGLEDGHTCLKALLDCAPPRQERTASNALPLFAANDSLAQENVVITSINRKSLARLLEIAKHEKMEAGPFLGTCQELEH